MTLRKKINFSILALLMVFAWLSPYCYGADCGFGSECPNTCPPCYKVTITGHKPCSCWEVAPLANGTYIVPNAGGCVWAGDDVNGYTMELVLSADAYNTIVHAPDGWIECGGWYCNFVWHCDSAFTDANGVGDCNNAYDEDDCWACDPETGTCYHFAYGGSAHWEPIWDCNECNNCGILNITVSDYNDTLHYAREDCCPPAEKGESEPITFDCNTANYVVPVYKIWKYDPNASGGWREVDDSNLVKVTSEPNKCSAGNSVTFWVQALKGQPPAKAKVQCTAAFFKTDGTNKSRSVTINIEPAEGECCESCSGGVCGGDGGSSPPDPWSLPSFGTILAGSTSFSAFPGMGAGDEISKVTLYDFGGGETGIDVKLPGKRHSYLLSKPLAFMPGWSASKDGSNDVTVQSPDGLKYIYPTNYDHKLRYIKDANDRNIVVFDYTGGLISKQSDGNDSDFYIEYGYEGGLLKTLTACDHTDCREYTITYDTANRAIAFSGNCEECGSGAFQYEYDANGLLKKVKDANDPNIVIYEYVYNANGWVTDIYLGEASDANHFRKFNYTPYGTSGSYIVDIYDYVDANNYRVMREYRNGAGLTTKRIRYETLNEDPADPIGEESYTEHTFYFYDANNVITKKVVIPPSRNSANPDPNSGIRKEYTYDPNTGRLLNEKWFAANEVNIPVISYTYGYVPDPCGNILDVRVLSSIDARDANTVYSYDGNEVVPKLKKMPDVTGGISEPNQLKYEYQYDSRKRVILEKQKDKNNTLLVQTKYDYDNYGNLLKRYDGYGDSNEITEYRYNGFNEMTRVSRPLGDSNVVSGRSYYDNGQLESDFVLADANDVNEGEPNLISQTKYFYDNNGRVKEIARAKGSGEFAFGSPASWIWTRYEYDLRGNKNKVIEDVNRLGLETAYEYDNQGEVIKVTLPNGKWTETVRDGRGMVAQTIVGHEGTTVATTWFYYDANGNLIEEVAPNNIRTTYEYDDFDRVTKITRGL